MPVLGGGSGPAGGERQRTRHSGMPGVRALGAIRIASNTQSIAGGVTMVPIYALWLPILLAAVIVFAVSSAIHMASPWHKNDYSKIPDERRFMDALRSLATP